MIVQDEYLAEVVVSYGATVVDFAHVADRYVIGEGPQVNLTTTGEALSDPDGFVLVRAEAGGFWLDFTAAMCGSASIDGRTRSLMELIRSEVAAPQAGRFCVLLRPGSEACIDRGRLQFRVRVVARELVRVRGRRSIAGFSATWAPARCLGSRCCG